MIRRLRRWWCGPSLEEMKADQLEYLVRVVREVELQQRTRNQVQR